jgi:uncharacterized Tic20 family protein
METNEYHVISKEERNWATIAHLSALSGFVVPFGTVLGPLVVWLLKKEAYPFVDDQGKEALNFQISFLIYTIVASVLMLLLIGFVLLPIVLIVEFVLTIVAAIKANEGLHYRYPLTIRFLK